MTKHYTFTDKAERDLEIVIDFTFERWGYVQTSKYIDGLEDRAQLLANNPDVGTKRPELFAELLSFPYKSHILYFVQTDDGITIIRVLHQRMDPTQHIK